MITAVSDQPAAGANVQDAKIAKSAKPNFSLRSLRSLGSVSLRARLTIWYSIALLAVLSIFAAIVLWQLGRIGVRRVDRELGDIAATLANVLQDELTEMPSPVAAAQEVNRTMAVPSRAMAILDANGHVMAATWSGLSLDT